MRFTALFALAFAVLSASAIPISNLSGAPGSKEATVQGLGVGGKIASSINGLKAAAGRRTVPGPNGLASHLGTVEKTVKAATGVVHARDAVVAEKTGKVEQTEKGLAGEVHARDATSKEGAIAGKQGFGQITKVEDIKTGFSRRVTTPVIDSNKVASGPIKDTAEVAKAGSAIKGEVAPAN